MAERILCGSLRNRGVVAKFRRQVPVGPYVADFACMAAKVIVELDGPPHADPARRDHDHRRDAWLQSQGWRILRFSNDAVIGGGLRVMAEIERALTGTHRSPSSDPR